MTDRRYLRYDGPTLLAAALSLSLGLLAAAVLEWLLP